MVMLPAQFETLTITSLHPIKMDRTIYGVLQSGEYGLELDAFDMKKRKFIKSFRKKNIAELIPFFFLFHLDSNYKKYGLLILQTFRNYGIKSIFSQFLNQFIGECIKSNPDKEFEIETNPVIRKDIVEKLDKSNTLQFRLIRYTLPKNCGDKYIDNPTEIVEERVFKVRRKKRLKFKMRSLTDLLENQQTNFYTFDGVDYDEIKFIIENQNKKRETLSATKKEVKIKEFKELSPLERDFEQGQTIENYLFKEAMEYIESLHAKGYNA